MAYPNVSQSNTKMTILDMVSILIFSPCEQVVYKYGNRQINKQIDGPARKHKHKLKKVSGQVAFDVIEDKRCHQWRQKDMNGQYDSDQNNRGHFVLLSNS